MLRLLAPILIAAAAIAVAPASATVKSPGAYVSVAARDATACARTCEDDGLCMAWAFHTGGACELSAAVPTLQPAQAQAFGLARRAPAFAHMRPGSSEPLSLAAIPVMANDPQPPALVHEPETEDSLALLGGPDESDLRPRLGANRQ